MEKMGMWDITWDRQGGTWQTGRYIAFHGIYKWQNNTTINKQ